MQKRCNQFLSSSNFCPAFFTVRYHEPSTFTGLNMSAVAASPF